jgi:hypothetical protein
MITYNWTISALDCKVDLNGLQDVVTTVHWRYRGTDEDGVTAETYGAQAVGEPNPDAFTPYPDLVESQVTGWLESEIDMEAIQENISKQIDLIKNPVQVTLPAPWTVSTITPIEGVVVEVEDAPEDEEDLDFEE